MPNGRMATALLLLINGAFFASIYVSGSQELVAAGAKWVPDILRGEWYRLVTAGYLHVQFVHILMNMMSLYNIGPLVEEIYGTRRMFTLYTVATVGGFFASSVWAPMVPSLGASAGIFGLLGALIAVGRHSSSHMAQNIRNQCLTNAAIGLVMGFVLPMIDNAAHLGGLAGGYAVAYFAGFPQGFDDSREKGWGLAALVAVLITLYSFYQMAVHTNTGGASY
jgi:rhomboid protease GluP